MIRTLAILQDKVRTLVVALSRAIHLPKNGTFPTPTPSSVEKIFSIEDEDPKIYENILKYHVHFTNFYLKFLI